KLPFRDDCLSHETFPKPVSLPLGNANTVSELFAIARLALGGPLQLALERELVVAIDCPRCDWQTKVLRPRTKVKAAEAICPNCGEQARPEFSSVVDEDSALAALSLAQCGIPPYDIVRIEGSSGTGFYLLAADADIRKPGGDHAVER